LRELIGLSKWLQDDCGTRPAARFPRIVFH
jgi:hypothetical protein